MPRRVELRKNATSDIPALTRRRQREPLEAVVFAGAAAAWPAVAQWTPDYFADHFGGVSVPCYRRLPDIMVPQAHKDASHRAVEVLADFVGHLNAGERCYIHSTDPRLFPGLDADFEFSPLLPEGSDPVFVKLCFGARTRSGLHFDPRDNYFAQIYGRKQVYLVAPSDRGRVYPFPADISKSQVDPTRNAEPGHRRFEGATVYQGVLEPGDVLFIPRGWWHHICAEDASISLNCFFGQPMTAGELAGGVTRANPLLWLPILRDAFRYGLCNASFDPGLFAAPPSGKIFYDIVFDRNGMRSLIPFRL